MVVMMVVVMVVVVKVVVMMVVVVVIRWPLSHPLHLVDGEGALRRLLLVTSAPVDLHIKYYHIHYIIYDLYGLYDHHIICYRILYHILYYISLSAPIDLKAHIVIIISTAWSPECRAGPYQQHRPH